MSIIDQKRKVFGNVAALSTLTSGMPNLKLSSSLPSVNNNGDVITLLTDLIKVLIGYDKLVSTLTETLTDQAPLIEQELKRFLKKELKSIVSCGVNPSLPSFIKSTGSGVVTPVDKIDFFDLLKTDPNSEAGKLLYNDVPTSILTDSTDLNTFLYGVIQKDGVSQTWNSTKQIIDITFQSQDNLNVNPNNSLIFKANPNYDNKSLTQFNDDFIDSLILFDTNNIINAIVDSSFGSISSSVKKTTKQLENEAKINDIINKIANSDNDDDIDDSYFTFTNEELQNQQREADIRKNGIRKLECCSKISASIPITNLTSFNDEYLTATTRSQKYEVVNKNITLLANQTAVNSNESSDNINIKLNFVQTMINNLTHVFVNTIISPKVISIFLINNKIIYGQSASYNDATDFMKKNKTLTETVVKKVNELIIKTLLTIAVKEITTRVSQFAMMEEIKKNKAKLATLLSLVGAPTSTIRSI